MTTTELIVLEGDKPIYASQLNDNFDLLDDNITALASSTSADIESINASIDAISGNIANVAKTNVANTFTKTNSFKAATFNGNVTITGSSFEFTRCTTKGTSSPTASNGKVAVVVSNYRVGKSWCRKWSDGWIEQGGNAQSGTNVSFIENFTTTDYNVQLTKSVTTYDDNFELLSATSRTTSKFYLSQSGFTYPIYADWYACGY